MLLLQSYKPDRERVQRLRAEMEAALPATTDPVDLAVAWHRKANAAEELQEKLAAERDGGVRVI